VTFDVKINLETEMDKKKELKEDQDVVHGTPGNTHFISLPTNEIFTESK
jgi:hypothetical protein